MVKCRKKVHSRNIVCVCVCVTLIITPYSVTFQYVSRTFFGSNYYSVSSTINTVRVLEDQTCDVTVTFSLRCSKELELITSQRACLAQSVFICCGQDDRVIGVRFPASAETFLHSLRTLCSPFS